MKLIICVLATVALALGASLPSEYSHLRDITEKPELQAVFDRMFPEFSYMRQQMSGTRIIGGSPAVTGQFPHQISLIIQDAWLCGGALISSNTVLTAAHCTTESTFAQAWAGGLTVGTGISRNSARLIDHPNYSDSTLHNDISLIILESPFDITATVHLIPLPRRSQVGTNYVNSIAQIKGFGRISDNSAIGNSNLMFATATIVSNTICANTYGAQFVTDNHICTQDQSE